MYVCIVLQHTVFFEVREEPIFNYVGISLLIRRIFRDTPICIFSRLLSCYFFSDYRVNAASEVPDLISRCNVIVQYHETVRLMSDLMIPSLIESLKTVQSNRLLAVVSLIFSCFFCVC